MKIRNGFVSNSSTSSFIIVGWQGKRLKYSDFKYSEANYDEENEDDYYSDIYEIDGVEFDYYPEEGLVGVSLPSAFDFDIQETELVLLEDALKKVKVIQSKLGYQEEPKLIYGTRQS